MGLEHFVMIPVILLVYLSFIPILIWAERRVSAWLQYRHGPNRVGPFGLFQPIADAIKFMFKEDILPAKANKWLYIIAPTIMVFVGFFSFAVIPWGTEAVVAGFTIPLQLGDLNIGILYVFAVSSLAVYSLTLGAWASNNKYSLMGGIRSAAQMISYELPMGIAVLGMIMLVGSLQMDDIVHYQQSTAWGVILQPVGFVIFLACVFAETNRLPFDLTEAEQELVGGYHTEYSSLKFAMFFLGEYCNMITGSALVVALYFGGWNIPFIDNSDIPGLVQFAVFFAKVTFFLFLFIWVRWTMPRFRYDQIMHLGWKKFIPITLINLVVTGIVMAMYYSA